MKTYLTAAILFLAGTMIYGQGSNNAKISQLGVYTPEMYYEEDSKEWKPVETKQEQIVESLAKIAAISDLDTVNVKTNSNKEDDYNRSFKNLAQKPKEVRVNNVPNLVYFPEGFSMQIPENVYNITRENGKYTFRHKDTPEEDAKFQVFVTNFDLQKSLADNNHFCVGKNRNLGVYAVYTVDKKTNTRDIIGFRLFYTLPINEKTYVTVRSGLFNSFEQYKLFVDHVVNLNYTNTYYASR